MYHMMHRGLLRVSKTTCLEVALCTQALQEYASSLNPDYLCMEALNETPSSLVQDSDNVAADHFWCA